MVDTGFAPVFTDKFKQTLQRIKILTCLLLLLYTTILILGLASFSSQLGYGIILNVVYTFSELYTFFWDKPISVAVVFFCRLFLWLYDIGWLTLLCVRHQDVIEISCIVLLCFTILLNPIVLYLYTTLPRYYQFCCFKGSDYQYCTLTRSYYSSAINAK